MLIASTNRKPFFSFLQACPLNPAPELQSEQEFSQRFAHVIRGVIDFAGMIPGFQLLTQDDKFTLLKAGLFDALFVRLICMFDSSINSIICLNGQVMRRDAIQNGANARFLVDSTFNFAERMNSMQLTDAEIGLFCAIVLITPDRPGLRNVELIEKMYTKLKACLQQVITRNRADQPEFLNELLKTLPDLRTLSTLHTEKLVVFRTEHKELLRQQMWSAMDDDAASKSPGSSSWGCDNSSLEDVAKSPMGSVSSTESGDTLGEYNHHHHHHNHHVHSHGPHLSSHPAASAPLLAATLAGNSPMSTSTSSCPITSSAAVLRNRANSGSSVEEDLASVAATAHLTQNGLTITPVVRHMPPTNSNGTVTVNGTTTASGAHQQQQRYRKLDSPTDSGIESGNEKHDHKMISSMANCSSSCSSGSSSCSSPRSTVDDGHLMAGESSSTSAVAPPTAAAKKFVVEDMPVLKRVLQAPPLYDTNSLMDEAYKPHKKFRAMRSSSISSGGSVHKEGASSSRGSPGPQSNEMVAESSAAVASSSTASSSSSIIVQPHNHHQMQMLHKPSASSGGQQSPAHTSQVPLMHQSQLHMHLTRPQQQQQNQYQNHQSSLSSTHSVLAKSLMEEPRMTPEQMKRSDIIQNYIKRESAADFNASLMANRRSPASSSSMSPSPGGNAGTISSPASYASGCPFAAKLRANSPFANSASVITTTTMGSQRRTPTPNGRPVSSPPMDQQQHRYFQSPHSTSAPSPRLMELQVDIADAQPVDLSKKSPSPSPVPQPQPPTSITITARNVTSPPPPSSSGSQSAPKLMLEA